MDRSPSDNPLVEAATTASSVYDSPSRPRGGLLFCASDLQNNLFGRPLPPPPKAPSIVFQRCKMYAYHDNRARWARTSRFAILPRPHTDGGSKLCHSRSGAAPHLFSTFHLIPLDRCVTLGLLASQLVRPARSAPEPPPKTTFCVNKTAGQGLFFYAGLRNTEHRGVCRSTPPLFFFPKSPMVG